MTTEFVLYHAPLSQPCRSILLLLKLTNAPYKEILIDLVKGEHRTPEFLAINPFHRVPVVVHGDFVLTESPAIAKYIINNVQCEDHWYPVDAKKRARYFREKISGKPVPQEEKDAAYTEFLEVVTGFENYFLSRGPFIIGDKISIADLFAVSEIIQAQLSGTDFLSDRPKLKEYVERVKNETSPHFDDVFKKIFEVILTRTK
ncbi:Glutathione S-transferase theta-3 [Holothuria leucospilota]|uniref:Glutathione S-transferase theta-3 n=1 Tax=Holothuria leucospilota TaxID=206669 RepID=A0A9Q0YM64_HOLLE|nr:Glutathione S-transferase theta-3 [Holothuria leucospilota]